jgi:hypothetical protein
MPRAQDHHAFCLHHSRDERQLLEAEHIGHLLAATPTGHYLTAADLNPVLGKLYTAIAQNRIPHRNAGLLAYVSQLLLHSVSLAKHEMIEARGPQYWRYLINHSLECSIPMPPPTPAALQLPRQPPKDPTPTPIPDPVTTATQPNSARPNSTPPTEPLPTPADEP